MSYCKPRPLQDADDISTFDCGTDSLNEYLHNRALANHMSGASRCFVTCRDGRVAGYYALTSSVVDHEDVAGKVRRNMPNPVPAILLARLAVDLKDQSNGVGASLLQDAIRRTVHVAEEVGVRVLLVHALHEDAQRFYRHFGFELSPTDPLHLMLLMKDARAALGHY